MMIIAPPLPGEYEGHFSTYINQANTTDLLPTLQHDIAGFTAFINSLPTHKLDYRYAEGKWTMKEIITHLTDAERIFAYRALRFARNDKTELAGFDENEYIPESNAANRTIGELLEEYEAVRHATLTLFKSFTPDMCLRTGVASGKRLSVRALGYIILGHSLHHQQVIRERYLN